MKTFKPLIWFFLLTAFVWACQKEVSLETGGSGNTSDGSLQGAGGACLGITVGGVYTKDTVLNSTNYVDVIVNVNIPGSYTISSDTVNGIFFRATGSFSAAGANTIRLQGSGKPIAPGTNTFTATYDSTSCNFSITTVLGTGGSTAVFTLNGSPNACSSATVQGTYTALTATNASNTATIHVNVTTIGTYTITTTVVNGVIFSKSGTFTTTGAQTIILNASGTPAAAGVFTIPITAGTTNCTFQLTVGSGSSAAVYSLNGAGGACTGAMVQGTYTVGVPLVAGTHTATVNVTVTTIGSYSITTNSGGGVSFGASGTFTATGSQPVVLQAGGTTTTAGTFTITVTAGVSTCTFPLTIVSAIVDYYPRTTNSNWSYEFDDDNTDTLYRNVIAPTITALGNPWNIFMYDDGIDVDSSGYFRKSGGDYYEYLDITGIFPFFDNSVWGEYIFLKDNVPASTTWNSNSFNGTVGGVPFMVRFKSTIHQKDVSVTVNAVNYPNTIVVKEEYQYFDGVNWISFPDLYVLAYFSRNIGLIKIEVFTNDGMNTFLGNQEITRHQVF